MGRLRRTKHAFTARAGAAEHGAVAASAENNAHAFAAGLKKHQHNKDDAYDNMKSQDGCLHAKCSLTRH